MNGDHYKTHFVEDTLPANQVPETGGSNAGNPTAYQKKAIIPFDTESNIDLGGDPAKAVSGKGLYDFVDPHYQVFGFTNPAADLVASTDTVIVQLTAPEDGMYQANAVVVVSGAAPAGNKGVMVGIIMAVGAGGLAYDTTSENGDTNNRWASTSETGPLNQGDVVDFILTSSASAFPLGQVRIQGNLVRVNPRIS